MHLCGSEDVDGIDVAPVYGVHPVAAPVMKSEFCLGRLGAAIVQIADECEFNRAFGSELCEDWQMNEL